MLTGRNQLIFFENYFFKLKLRNVNIIIFKIFIYINIE